MPRCCRTRQIVNLVNFQKDRIDDIMPNQLEIRQAEKMTNVRLLARKEIVDTNNVMSLRNEHFTKMRSQKTGSAGHKYPFDSSHTIKTGFPLSLDSASGFVVGDFCFMLQSQANVV